MGRKGSAAIFAHCLRWTTSYLGPTYRPAASHVLLVHQLSDDTAIKQMRIETNAIWHYSAVKFLHPPKHSTIGIAVRGTVRGYFSQWYLPHISVFGRFPETIRSQRSKEPNHGLAFCCRRSHPFECQTPRHVRYSRDFHSPSARRD